MPRQFYGCELKDEYYHEACRNLAKAESQTEIEESASLFGNTK
jgi:hypothetical protein